MRPSSSSLALKPISSPSRHGGLSLREMIGWNSGKIPFLQIFSPVGDRPSLHQHPLHKLEKLSRYTPHTCMNPTHYLVSVIEANLSAASKSIEVRLDSIPLRCSTKSTSVCPVIDAIVLSSKRSGCMFCR